MMRLSSAMSTKNVASQAMAKANGTHYWAFGPYVVFMGTNGWTYDSDNDRYYQDVAVNGMTPSLMPFVSCSKVGGFFPLCGCESLDSAVRLFLTDAPTVSAMVTIYGLGVRS